jgi:hypothetical protein
MVQSSRDIGADKADKAGPQPFTPSIVTTEREADVSVYLRTVHLAPTESETDYLRMSD